MGAPRRAGFGTGEPEGIIATEAANSAVVGANLVPTIALGIPGNVAAALLIGAFIMHGVIPGPFMLRQNGALIYALFASMILANGIHLLIGRLGTDIWIRFAVIPRGLILPPVVLFCLLGAYLPSQSLWDVGTMLAFTGVGLAMRRLGYPVVCLVIGFLLGGKFEISLRQTLLLYQGRYDDILHSPFALIFLALTLVILLLSFRRSETA
jgi:putative tricarboxylic transport membrane protein